MLFLRNFFALSSDVVTVIREEGGEGSGELISFNSCEEEEGGGGKALHDEEK
jgi:hypothetical protein